MMESPAYRVMSLSAHRIVARIRIELAHHGGKDNGKLPVTFRDFNEYGVHWNAIAPAIREAEALGFIRVTQYGRAGNGEFRIPNTFALTHMPVDEQRPTNDWAKIETIEEAEIVAGAARNKQKASIGKRSSTRYGKRSSNPKLPVSESVSLSTTESVSLSISRVGNAAAGGEGSEDPALTGLREWTTSTLTEVKYTPELKRLYSQAI